MTPLDAVTLAKLDWWGRNIKKAEKKGCKWGKNLDFRCFFRCKWGISDKYASKKLFDASFLLFLKSGEEISKKQRKRLQVGKEA